MPYIFIASKHSVKAKYQKYEIGGVFYDEKEIVPVFIDVSPKELPHIIRKY